MIQYYLKSAIQSLRGSLKFTILNIISFSLGLALVSMMVMLITYELSFDNCHPNRDSILQVIQHDLKAGEYSTVCPLPLPATILEEFPEVLYATGISRLINPETVLDWDDQTFSGFTGASVDNDFIQIFGYELLTGNPEKLANAPDRILVSERLAKTVFGDANPLGQTISISDHPFIISGIFKDKPQNTSVRFDMLFSEEARSFIRPDYNKAWWHGGMQVYVMLQPGTGVESFEDHLRTIPDRHYPDFLKGRSTFTTRPFKGSHFDMSVHDYYTTPVSKSYLIILASITLVTLLIACVNYINLYTSQYTRRSMDTGIRQILGARSVHVIRMHLCSAFILIVFAFGISIVVLKLAMPVVESITQRPVSQQISSPLVWVILGITILITGIITGYLPGKSFVHAEPIQLVQNKGIMGAHPTYARNMMIVFQFTLSIALIIVQLFIFRQVHFMKNAELGFDNNNLLSIELNSNRNTIPDINFFKEQVESQMARFGFSRGSITENIPGYYYQNSFTVIAEGAVRDELLVIATSVDEYFLKVFGIEMVEGRFFSPEFRTDNMNFIINETAMKSIGWENTDGKFLKLQYEGKSYPVVGVIKDIHTTTLKEPIKPMIYRFGAHNNYPGFLTFRLSPGKWTETIEFMESEWQKVFRDTPFLYFDVREKYFENYREEKRFSRIIGSFTIIAILLSLLGLLGLVSFLSEQRQKEIGIRKVNGANIREILFMINRHFLKWIGIAFLVAVPIASIAAREWLKGFAFKTGLSPLVFLTAAFLVLFISFVTVSWQSWKAASLNPSESLRYE